MILGVIKSLKISLSNHGLIPLRKGNDFKCDHIIVNLRTRCVCVWTLASFSNISPHLHCLLIYSLLQLWIKVYHSWKGSIEIASARSLPNFGPTRDNHIYKSTRAKLARENYLCFRHILKWTIGITICLCCVFVTLTTLKYLKYWKILPSHILENRSGIEESI